MLRFPSMTMFEGRASLQRYIVDEARRIAPDAITFHFSQSIAQLDLAGRTLRLVPSAAGSSSGGSSSGDGNGGGSGGGGGGGEARMTSTGSGAAAEGRGGGGGDAAAAGSVQYDLLVGADGANSCVRKALTEQVARGSWWLASRLAWILHTAFCRAPDDGALGLQYDMHPGGSTACRWPASQRTCRTSTRCTSASTRSPTTAWPRSVASKLLNPACT